MNVLLFTGSSGFLGKNILPALREHYNVSTLDLQDADYTCNLAKEAFEPKEAFDIVLHAAGKAHVIPKTEAEKRAFFDVNYRGTVNLCRSLEKSRTPGAFIFISTIAVYGCEHGVNINEDCPKNGATPYALSKIEAEDFLTEWCRSIMLLYRYCGLR